MFCPTCGRPDQKADSFCRQCGTYLPDFDKIKKREMTPEDHLKANSFLNFLTALVSLSLAIALYIIFLGKDDTPFIIYLVAGFLTAMSAWQVQTFWRTQLLKKHFRRQTGRMDPTPAEEPPELELSSTPTRDLLNEADHSRAPAADIAEFATRKLGEKVRRKSP